MIGGMKARAKSLLATVFFVLSGVWSAEPAGAPPGAVAALLAAPQDPTPTSLLDVAGWYCQVTIEVNGSWGHTNDVSSSNYSVSRRATLSFRLSQRMVAKGHWTAATTDETAVSVDIQDRGYRTDDDLDKNGNVYYYAAASGGGSERKWALHQLFLDPAQGTYRLVIPSLQSGTVVRTSSSSRGRADPPVESPVNVSAPLPPQKLPAAGTTLAGSIDLPPAQLGVIGPGLSEKAKNMRGTITWRLSPLPPEQVELVIEPPDDYRTWLPVASESETKAGSRLPVKARLQKPDGSPSLRKAKRFTFELVDVSHEPGTCLNWPIAGAQSTPDLAFEPSVSRLVVDEPLSLRGVTAEGEYTTVTAVISCFDHGATGDVRVTAEMVDGEVLIGRLADHPSRQYLAIPYREQGSRIADAWVRRFGVRNQADAADAENDPVGDGFPGDGLALYEEYRGIVDRNGHRRLDPNKRELFVSCRLGRDADAEIAYFEKLTGLVVRLLGADGHPEREVNPNRSPSAPFRCKQHLVVLGGPAGFVDVAVDQTGGKTVLEARRRRKVTPASVKRIVIGDTANAGADYRRVAIVHELLHAVGVLHHGDGDRIAGVEWRRSADGKQVLEDGRPIEVFLESADPVPLRAFDNQFDAPFRVVVAVQGGAFSGNESCVMRYAGPDAYVHPTNGSNRRFYLGRETPEVWGLELCDSKEGTGVAGRRYGNATRGDCRHQIRVSDAE